MVVRIFGWIVMIATVMMMAVGCDRDSGEHDSGALTPASDSNTVKWVEQKGADTFTIDTKVETTVKGGLWKTLTCGKKENGDDYLNALRAAGYDFNRQIERILGTIAFATLKEETEVKIGKVKIADVFKGPVTPHEIYNFVMANDIFEPTPGEAALEAREVYTDQPADEVMLVVSSKLTMFKSQERWLLGLKGGPTQGVIAIPMSEELDPRVEYMLVAMRE